MSQEQEWTPPQPTDEHLWLQRFVGEWETQSGDCMAGSESVRSIGGFWIVAEADGKMPDGDDAMSITTIGFNSDTGRFVGSWIGSMMTWHWVYDGWLEGNTLVLESEGPAMDGNGRGLYRDNHDIINENERVLRAEMQGPDGTWTEFMRTTYRRK